MIHNKDHYYNNNFKMDPIEWKDLAIGLGGALSAVSLWVGKYSWNRVKKRDNNIEARLTKLEKTACKLEKTVGEMREILIFKDKSGKESTLKEKVSEINHRLLNKDLAEASAFDEILELLKLRNNK